MVKWLCLFAIAALSSTLVLAQDDPPGANAPGEIVFEMEYEWRTLFEGIEGTKLRVKQPRQMSICVVRIALETPGLEFVSTGDNGDRRDETDGMFTSTFLKREKCQVAINAGVFSPVTNDEGTAKDILGLHIAKGKLVSPWQDGYQVLAIEKDNRGSFLRTDPKDYSKIETAVSGFKVVLWEGKVRKGDETIHPRTLVGLSKDRKTMYWMVIDGRQSGHSEGATKTEAGQLMKQLGADAALNLDGGGTSTLVIENSDGNPKVLNRPIHGGAPGKERPSASHLGVRVGKR